MPIRQWAIELLGVFNLSRAEYWDQQNLAFNAWTLTMIGYVSKIHNLHNIHIETQSPNLARGSFQSKLLKSSQIVFSWYIWIVRILVMKYLASSVSSCIICIIQKRLKNISMFWKWQSSSEQECSWEILNPSSHGIVAQLNFYLSLKIYGSSRLWSSPVFKYNVILISQCKVGAFVVKVWERSMN